MSYLPRDTTEEAWQIQFDIMASKTISERMQILDEMCETASEIVLADIKRQFPGIGKGELIAKKVERYYADEFSEEEMQKIKASIIQFHSELHD